MTFKLMCKVEGDNSTFKRDDKFILECVENNNIVTCYLYPVTFRGNKRIIELELINKKEEYKKVNIKLSQEEYDDLKKEYETKTFLGEHYKDRFWVIEYFEKRKPVLINNIIQDFLLNSGITISLS